MAIIPDRFKRHFIPPAVSSAPELKDITLDDLMKAAEAAKRPAFKINRVFDSAHDPFQKMSAIEAQRYMSQAKAEMAKAYSDQIDAAAFGILSGQGPMMQGTAAANPDTLKGVRLFSDKSDGFSFERPAWKNAVAIQGKEYMARDATAHRDEALRRRVVCRLEELQQEADHWHAQMRFLENLCNLKPYNDETNSIL